MEINKSVFLQDLKLMHYKSFQGKIGVSFVGLLFFTHMLKGTVYLLKFSTDMLIRNIELG